jgi:hypothetical protein
VVQGVEGTDLNVVVLVVRVKLVDTAEDALVAALAVANVQPALVTRAKSAAVLNGAAVVDADAKHCICVNIYVIIYCMLLYTIYFIITTTILLL